MFKISIELINLKREAVALLWQVNPLKKALPLAT